MAKIPSFLILVTTLGLGDLGWARKVSLETETFATYLRGNIGLTEMGKTAFKDSSGAQTQFTQEVNYLYGGEFGFILKGKTLGLRLGVEVLNPKKISGAEGVNSSGTVLMTLTSQVTALVPTAALEIGFVTKPTWRVYGTGGVGYGLATVLNEYTLTSAGSTAYTGMVNYTEEVRGNALMGEATGGIEFILADNTAFSFELGYRYLRVTRLDHVRAVKTFLGDVGAGSTAKNADGSDRSLNFSSGFVGIGLRFYL